MLAEVGGSGDEFVKQERKLAALSQVGVSLLAGNTVWRNTPVMEIVAV